MSERTFFGVLTPEQASGTLWPAVSALVSQAIPYGRRLYFKGGGGGGGGQVYYANQDKLAGVQADIATNLYNQYAAYAPQALGDLAGMVTDAQNGQYTQDLRNRAGTAADDAAMVLTNLTALSRAIEDREHALLVASWAHKKNIGDLADLGDIYAIINYDVTTGWPT